MNISVIIPTCNEAMFIAKTIRAVKKRAFDESRLQIIVADGGSDDATVEKAKEAGAAVVDVERMRRSVQLNRGAEAAAGSILYFLHADTLPPIHFDSHIVGSIKHGKQAGCFRLSFDYSHFLLRFYGWCTRFDVDLFRFGDQSLFITKELFTKIDGYRNDHILLEDYDIVKRIKKSCAFSILSESVITSSRKYRRNGVLRLQCIYAVIMMLYKLGLRQPVLRRLYQKLVH